MAGSVAIRVLTCTKYRELLRTNQSFSGFYQECSDNAQNLTLEPLSLATESNYLPGDYQNWVRTENINVRRDDYVRIKNDSWNTQVSLVVLTFSNVADLAYFRLRWPEFKLER